MHLIDARANTCVRSWSEDELHGLDVPSDPAQGHSPFAYGHDRLDPHVLSWSKDGCSLAIASSTLLTSGARCSVLHFSASSS